MLPSDGQVNHIPFLDLNVAASHIIILSWNLPFLFVVWY